MCLGGSVSDPVSCRQPAQHGAPISLDVPTSALQGAIQEQEKSKETVSHPVNDGQRHTVKRVLEVKAKDCGMLIRCMRGLNITVGKFASTRNATPRRCGAKKTAGLVSRPGEN